MKRITNSQQVQNAIEKLDLNSNFSTEGLQFEILCYEKGEQMVSPIASLNSFLFLFSGNVRIYQLNADSSIYGVATLSPGKILGYNEFCFESAEYTLYAEALTDVKCLVLPFQQASRRLNLDSTFLMFLLKNNLLDSIQQSQIHQRQMHLEEQLLFYLQHICENNTMTSVNNAMDVLHCSRRTLQRVLKQMCDQGKIIHTKKGCYKLI